MSVFPAQAGIQLSAFSAVESWTPAFAGGTAGKKIWGTANAKNIGHEENRIYIRSPLPPSNKYVRCGSKLKLIGVSSSWRKLRLHLATTSCSPAKAATSV